MTYFGTDIITGSLAQHPDLAMCQLTHMQLIPHHPPPLHHPHTKTKLHPPASRVPLPISSPGAALGRGGRLTTSWQIGTRGAGIRNLHFCKYLGNNQNKWVWSEPKLWLETFSTVCAKQVFRFRKICFNLYFVLCLLNNTSDRRENCCM